jgi:hypothetical protein
MGEHGEMFQKKQDDKGQKHRTGAKKAGEPPGSPEKQSADALTETPFFPRMKEHANTLAGMPFAAQRHNFVRRLHQTYGSLYVQRLLASMNVQARLTVSDPDDSYEQEANRVADTIVRVINSPAQRQAPEEEEEELIQGKADVQRQVPEEEEELIQGKADVQRLAPEEEEELQMQPDTDPAATVADAVEARIDKARGGGQPLSAEVKEPMEQAFGADFSHVRTHTDAEADTLNKQLSAKAFTTGEDIFFRDGEYSPGSSSGQHLIAHELTHVVQQMGGRRLQREDDDEEGQVPAEGKKEGFWRKVWNGLKAIGEAVGEAAWEAVQELLVDAVEGLGIFSVFAGVKKLYDIVREAIEARQRQKAYEAKLSEEGEITPNLMKQVEYGARNSFKQFSAACIEFLKELVIFINDIIAIIGGTITAGVLTAAAECVNLCLSITSWVGKQFKRFINWLVGGDRQRKRRASVIVNAAVEPGAGAADRDLAVGLITDLHVTTPDEVIKIWEAEKSERENTPNEVDEDMLDWIREEPVGTRKKIKAELIDSVADTMRGFFW